MRRSAAVVAALVAALLPAPADAQLPTLQPGLRVRVDARPATAERMVGIVMEQTPDTIVVVSNANDWHRVPVARVATVEVDMGRSRWTGLRRGFLLGTALIGVPAYIGGRLATDDDFVFPIAAVGAGVGALVGFFVGADRWRRVFSREAAPAG